MTKSEAIKVLEKYKRYAEGILTDEVLDSIAFDMAIESLQTEQKWIPCSERLPEKDGRYLVCMSWDYHYMDVYMWADGWNCVRRINGKVDRESEIDGADILAWMPLPNPYREDDEE